MNKQQIFVFGSNLEGIHGAGAALFAARHFGAVRGVGLGPTGYAYAIPTKATPFGVGLPLHTINDFVQSFKGWARMHYDTPFKVSRVGCGRAGWTDEDIAPMFFDSPSNCTFDPIWTKKFNYPIWMDIAVA